METLRLNFILYSTEKTGGTRTILNYIAEMAKMGHEVTVTTIYDSHWFDLPDSVRVISKSTKFDLYKLYATTKYLRRLTRTNVSFHMSILKKLYFMSPDSDINVATFFPTAYVASWLKKNAIPFYLLMHMPEYFVNDQIERQFFHDTLYLKLNTIVNSSWLRNRVFEETGSNFDLMNMGAVDTEIFHPVSISQIKNDINTVNIVALGKGGFKNSIGIFEAVQKLRKIIPQKEIKLHYFGLKRPIGIPFDNSLNYFHRDLSDIELADLFRMSDIQVTFSEAESFPLPPLEGMASGCAVVTTPFGTEDYAVDGENAMIVEPNNVDMLAEKIKILIEDENLRSRLKYNGIKTSGRFTYTDQAKTLEERFKSATNDNTIQHL